MEETEPIFPMPGPPTGPDTVRVKLISPNGPRRISDTGASVAQGEEIDVPSALAAGLLIDDSAWLPVDKAAKDIIKGFTVDSSKEA